MPNEHPILFSGPMVRAILEGRKTQTRRIIKPQPTMRLELSELPATIGQWFDEKAFYWKCPFGKIGDQLWVRETWFYQEWLNIPLNQLQPVQYAADETMGALEDWRKMPSIHMPRWASRITLEITDVRTERLQDIWEKSHTFDECFREGIPQETTWDGEGAVPTPLALFIDLWNSINAKRGYSWASNPFVWCIAFKRMDGVKDHATYIDLDEDDPGAIHTCGRCGRPLQIVRPGKYQCSRCD